MRDHLTLLFKPIGGFKDALPRSDTIFGAISWAWRLLFGISDLESLLQKFANHDPPFRITSAFPALETQNEIHFFFPTPHWTFTSHSLDPKKFKEIQWIEHRLFQQVLEGSLAPEKIVSDLDAKVLQSLDGFLVQEDVPLSPPKTTSVPHSSINRLKNSPDEGMFYHTQEVLIPPYSPWTTFVLADVLPDYKDKLLSSLEFLSIKGLGGDFSQGRGQYHFKHTEDWPIQTPHQANAWLTLSLFLPDPQDWHEIKTQTTPSLPSYQITTRRGYVDSSWVPGGKIWKQAVPVMTEGSLFPVLSKKFPGSFPIVRHVLDPNHPRGEFDVYFYGYAFPIPIIMGGVS